MKLLALAGGGALGALARYGVVQLTLAIWKKPFPLGTLLVNLSGCFAMGLFAAWATRHPSIDPLWRLFIVSGFLGAYTTFSAFEYDTHMLAGSGATLLAIVNVVASVAVGFAALRFGLALAAK